MLKTLMMTGAAACLLSSAALADTPAGFYLDLSGGANFLDDADTTGIDVETGFAVAGSAGYKLDNGFRVELELGYRKNNYDFSFPGIASGDGAADAFSQMVNVLYDIDIAPGYALSLGGGLGGSRVHVDATTAGGLSLINSRDYVFAYQGIAEIETMVGDNVGLFAGYNYFRADNATFAASPDEADYRAHTASIGVRFHFAEVEVAAPPPPPPPPPPAAAKTFIVFFNFDQSDLTPEAQAVVAEAASAYKSTGAVTISVIGHTDTVGSAAYNQPLSERRAASVRAGLTANGVSSDVISTSGRGFSDPLVPTGPGVKEPQNRRATIDLTGSAM